MTIPGVQSSEAESVGWRCLLARRVLTLIQVYPWCWCSPLSSLPSCPSQSFWSSAGNYNCSPTQTTHLQENYSREMSPKCSSFNLLLVFANFGFTMLGGFVWSLCAPHCCLWSYLQLCLCHRCYIDMLPFLSWDTLLVWNHSLVPSSSTVLKVNSTTLTVESPWYPSNWLSITTLLSLHLW